MAAPAAPSYPGNKPSGNPHPRRGQIKAKIVRDLISAVASIAGRRMPAAAAEHAGLSGAAAAADEISAAPPPEQLPIAVV